MKKLFLILTAFLILLSGCASLKPVDSDQYISKAEVEKLIQANRMALYELMQESEAYYIRAFTAKNGGATGAMDAVGCQSLNTNDLGLVFDVAADAMFFYKYDSTATAAEDTTHFSVIEPDDVDANCAGSGNWELFSSMNFAPSTAPAWSFRDSDSTNTNKTVGQITVDYIDGSAGSANADMCFKVLQNGDGTSMTTVFCFDESDDAWETTKNITTTAKISADDNSSSGINVQTPQSKTYDNHDDDDETIGTDFTSSIVQITGDNDTDNDSIDLQDGTEAGQILVFIAVSNVDSDDTFTIDAETDSTCSGCPDSGIIAMDAVGDIRIFYWTGSAWILTGVTEGN